MLKHFFRIETVCLFHPFCPGDKVWVTRGWVGRLFKPTDFATLGEL